MTSRRGRVFVETTDGEHCISDNRFGLAEAGNEFAPEGCVERAGKDWRGAVEEELKGAFLSGLDDDGA